MPEDDGDTSIRIKIDTWNRLKDRKRLPNQSFDDIINHLLDQTEEDDKGNLNPATTVTD